MGSEMLSIPEFVYVGNLTYPIYFLWELLFILSARYDIFVASVKDSFNMMCVHCEICLFSLHSSI